MSEGFPRRILILHNRYVWPGGEDATVTADARLLRERGHEVIEHWADNRELIAGGRLAALRALATAAWSRKSRQLVAGLLERHRPDLMHVHNTWFALTPAVFSAARAAGVPAVATLHNFRLVCPGGVLLDAAGRPCRACLGRLPWRGVYQGCYRGSRAASLAVAWMELFNRWRGTWQREVDLFVVPSRFCAATLADSGLPAERLAVRPHFVDDPGSPQPPPAGPRRVLYVGRLSTEKGLKTLLQAWRDLPPTPAAELHLVGDGPQAEELRTLADARVSFRGRLESTELAAELKSAAFLVLPSECYETFGRVVIEAYAHGRPAIVSHLGGPAELVGTPPPGRLFTAGNEEQLRIQMAELINQPELTENLGQTARATYLSQYTPTHGYSNLIECYRQARENYILSTRKNLLNPNPML